MVFENHRSNKQKADLKRLIEDALVAADEFGLVEVAIDLSSALAKLDQPASSSE